MYIIFNNQPRNLRSNLWFSHCSLGIACRFDGIHYINLLSPLSLSKNLHKMCVLTAYQKRMPTSVSLQRMESDTRDVLKGTPWHPFNNSSDKNISNRVINPMNRITLIQSGIVENRNKVFMSTSCRQFYFWLFCSGSIAQVLRVNPPAGDCP